MIKITYKRSGVEDYREFRNKEEFEDWLDRQKKIEEIQFQENQINRYDKNKRT